MFKVFGSSGRKYCWRRRGQLLSDSQVYPKAKHGGGNIMVWGCFTCHGVGYLCRINQSLDAELYRQILDIDFKGTLAFYNLEKDKIIFQQDNDPKHTAKLTKQWFIDNQIPLLEWPVQSPDLNPMEYLWSEIDSRLGNLS